MLFAQKQNAVKCSNIKAVCYILLKDLKEIKKANINMLLSGFIDGQLIYVIEFPFNSKYFITRLKKQLLNRFPKGKDVVGEYLRSATFRLEDYKNSDIKIIYLNNKSLDEYKDFFTDKLYLFLKDF